jgi:hypothetical protein
MKKIIFSWLLSVMFLTAATAQYGTNRTGYEGDYFSLEGAVELFKQSYTIRDFERKLNTEDSWVNNLDLDYDGRIDYIRVEHRRQGQYHAIVLQIPLGRYDFQDVAVIEIEKVGRRQAVLQIIGDEDLYGEQVIVEPYESEGYYYDRGNYRGYVNVYYWDAVQSIFDYNYHVYVSPYSYRYYPTWWSPWRQCGWNVYRPRIVVYHRHHHVVRVHRVIHVHNFYKPHRTYSHNVLTRTNEVRVKHGKQPVHRTAVKRDNKRNDYERENNRVAEQPRNAKSNDRAKNERLNQRVPSTVERSSTKANKEPRNTTTRPSTSRANKQPERSTSTTKRSTPSRDSKATRNTPSSSNKASRNTTTKKSAPRSTPKASSPSRSTTTKKSSSRSTPKASSSSRSSSSNKSQGASRSTKQAPRSSAGSSRSSSSSKKAKRSTSSKSSSSKNKRG